MTLLVAAGHDREYVEQTMSMDAFRAACLSVTKLKLLEARHTSLILLGTIASVLSKDKGNKSEQEFDESIQKLDTKILSSLGYETYDDDEYDYVEEPRRGQKFRRRKREKGKVDMDMLRAFHQNFTRLMGLPLPNLDHIHQRATEEQQHRLLLAQKKTAEQASQKPSPVDSNDLSDYD